VRVGVFGANPSAAPVVAWVVEPTASSSLPPLAPAPSLPAFHTPTLDLSVADAVSAGRHADVVAPELLSFVYAAAAALRRPRGSSIAASIYRSACDYGNVQYVAYMRVVYSRVLLSS